MGQICNCQHGAGEQSDASTVLEINPAQDLIVNAPAVPVTVSSKAITDINSANASLPDQAGDASLTAPPSLVFDGRSEPLETQEAINRFQHGGSSDTASALERLEASLANVRKHCRRCRLLEAMEGLKTLEVELASTLKVAVTEKDDDALNAAVAMSETLKSDVGLTKLRAIHGRIIGYLSANGILAKSMQGPDSAWAMASKREPRIGEHFIMKCRMRALEPSERMEGFGATQVLFRIDIENWPAPIEELAALDRETDLYKKEFIEDCRDVHGVVGGSELLWSSLLHYLIRPAMLPIATLEFLYIREYVICDESPVNGFPAGAFVVEDTPIAPGGCDFEGFPIPPDRAATKRVVFRTCKHISRSRDHPECSTETIVTVAGVSIPAWIVPCTLLNRIILHTTMLSFLNFKQKLADEWEKSGMAARMDGAHEFYEAVRSVPQSTAR